MEAYFAFTDECGQYQKIRNEKFLRAHPFYVRSTVIISWTDYLILQKEMENVKIEFGLDARVEIKWSHYGNAIKNNYKDVPHKLTPIQLKNYFSRILSTLCNLKSVSLYYTITDNRSLGKVSEVALLRMHLQNALQRVQITVSDLDGFAILVADDLNDKTKELKQATYEMMMSGDYVQYTHVKNGLYIDFSNQCPGLQTADIIAGIFTASLKFEQSSAEDKHKFMCGHELLFSQAYKKTRQGFIHPPNFDVYRIGVKEVPNGAGEDIAKAISRQIEAKLENDLAIEMFSDQ